MSKKTIVDTVSQSKIWKPVAIIGGILGTVAIVIAIKDYMEAQQIAKQKEEVKQGLETVKEVLVSETTESFSGCGGCSSAAGGNTKDYPMKENYAGRVYSDANGANRADKAQIINPSEVITPQIYVD